MTKIAERTTAVEPLKRRWNRWLRGATVCLVAVLTLGGCTSPTVVEGSEVTVATSAALFSLNDRTSYGNSAGNSGILVAVNSSFNRYGAKADLLEDTSFGSYQLISNDPLTVQYTIAPGVTWSDGVPVDAADLMLAWVANSGSLNTQGFDDAGYRDLETGQYAAPFDDDVVYFDGTTSEGLQYATAVPEISADNRSLTVVWDNYIVDWPLLLQVGLPAHVVASKALGLSLAEDTAVSDSEADPDRLADAQKAKRALTAAIRDGDTAALSKIANFWNSGFDLDGMPADSSLLVSTGPYTITDFVPNVSVTLTANSRYRGDHNPVYETVTVRFIAEPLDQVAALESGAVDVIVPRPSAEALEALEQVEGVTIVRLPGGTYEHLDLTVAHGKHSTFADMRVREAFLKTVPTQKIRDEVISSPLADTAERASLVFLPGASGYSDASTANGSERFAQVDIAGAKALLADAGVSSPRVCIMFDPSNPKRVLEYQLIAESALTAGFIVTNCSGPDWRNLLGTPGTYDAALFAWTSSNTSVVGLQSIFETGASGNLNNYSNPEVDRLLAQLAVTFDPEEQQILRAELDTELYSDAYGLPLYQDQFVVAHNATVTGVTPATLTRGILWNIWEWTPVEESATNPPAVT